MTYKKQLSLQDLMNNSQLEGIIPQASTTKDMAKSAATYIQGALKGRVTGKNEITVKGSRKAVLRRVRQMLPMVEALFGGMDTIAANMQSGAKLYMPCAGMNAVKSVKSFNKKMELLSAILENLTYNPDFVGNAAGRSLLYRRQQKDWKSKVGYKE